MIIVISLVTICHHTNHYIIIDFPLTIHFHTHDSFILQLEVCTSWSPSLISPSPLFSRLATAYLFFGSMNLFLFSFVCSFVWFFRFNIKVKSYSIFVHLSVNNIGLLRYLGLVFIFKNITRLQYAAQEPSFSRCDSDSVKPLVNWRAVLSLRFFFFLIWVSHSALYSRL